ncbi:hypothetical protein [Streptomyces abikoensis]|uniref:hypothetical protein n=1 Tax=Streptomyces abikoensis TaxID=97398 RepID=UPI001673BFA1|nr:hypothetical protein [Streptomyces abikoensis]GGP40956.1 hypothetical protein GCM10010214_12920 [Streptomyces abikoensis]
MDLTPADRVAGARSSAEAARILQEALEDPRGHLASLYDLLERAGIWFDEHPGPAPGDAAQRLRDAASALDAIGDDVVRVTEDLIRSQAPTPRGTGPRPHTVHPFGPPGPSLPPRAAAPPGHRPRR